MLTVTAPAKLNLTLEVLGKHPDGYHEIRSVMQKIDLCDTLSFKAADETTITSDMQGWSAEESLITKAIKLLRETTGCNHNVALHVEKQIPLMSGLGGDSSNAASVLRGLNEFWVLDINHDKLLELATGLGSDVSFFLQGSTAVAEGRGEILTPLPSLPKAHVVLVIPDVPVEPGKTGRMYQGLRTYHYTDGSITQKLVDMIRCRSEFNVSLLFNAFENVAYDIFPNLLVYKEHLLKLGAPNVQLAGSGPALFTLFQNVTVAEELYTRCRDQGMKVFLTKTL